MDPAKDNFATLSTSRRISLGVVILQLLKGCLSIALVMLTAKLFGTSIYRDAWVIAWSVQIIVFKLLFGPINEIFRSKFAIIKQQNGEEKALQSVFSLSILLALICLLVIFLFYLFEPNLVTWFAPGYTNVADTVIIQQMILYLIPTLFFSELVSIFVSLLNSYKSFFLPEVFGLFSITFNIVLLLLAGKHFGIYTLVIANYCSIIIFVLSLVYHLLKRGVYPRIWKISLSSASPFLLFGLPLYLTYFAGQLNAWVERIFVSYLSLGATSSLDYARKYIDMPITIIISIGVTVMTPMLASIWTKEGKSIEFKKNYFTYLRLALIVISPIVFLLTICSSDIVLLLLNRGSFDEQWLEPTAQTLRWFGFGLFGVVFYVISGQTLLVQGRSMLYGIIGVCSQLLPIVINMAFYKASGISIFGFSWCFAQVASGIAMFLILKNNDRKLLFSFLILVCILSFNLILGNFILKMFYFLPSFWRVLVSFSGYLFGVLISFMVLKIEEFQSLKRMFQFHK